MAKKKKPSKKDEEPRALHPLIEGRTLFRQLEEADKVLGANVNEDAMRDATAVILSLGEMWIDWAERFFKFSRRYRPIMDQQIPVNPDHSEMLLRQLDRVSGILGTYSAFDKERLTTHDKARMTSLKKEKESLEQRLAAMVAPRNGQE